MNLKVRVGDLVPWFIGRTAENPRYAFDTTGGLNVLLTFTASASGPFERKLLTGLSNVPQLFDEKDSKWFIVSPDPDDEAPGRLPLRIPGIRGFYDRDHEIASAFGVEYKPGQPISYLISPRQQIFGIILSGDPERQINTIARVLENSIPVADIDRVWGSAPIVIVPYVFDSNLCKELIARYDRQGGAPSGFMQEIDGRTVGVHDDRHKVRRDIVLTDSALIDMIHGLFKQRVMPQIQRAYQYQGQYMERYIVACYDSAEGGHFGRHRDNGTAGTAHRRFAATVNLNDDYDGGELRFPEFGTRTYHPPSGAALVFSCSLLHQVLAMRRGKRYAFLPFIYDEKGARTRYENAHLLSE